MPLGERQKQPCRCVSTGEHWEGAEDWRVSEEGERRREKREECSAWMERMLVEESGREAVQGHVLLEVLLVSHSKVSKCWGASWELGMCFFPQGDSVILTVGPDEAFQVNGNKFFPSLLRAAPSTDNAHLKLGVAPGAGPSPELCCRIPRGCLHTHTLGS